MNFQIKNMENYKKENQNKILIKQNKIYLKLFNYNHKYIKISFLFVIILLLIFPSNYLINKIDIHFEYHNYQRNKITEKMKNYAGWQQINDQPYFI